MGHERRQESSTKDFPKWRGRPNARRNSRNDRRKVTEGPTRLCDFVCIATDLVGTTRKVRYCVWSNHA